MVIGDEAAFHLNGKVTTQNVRQNAPRGENHDFMFERKLSKEKKTVWMGLYGNGVLEPFFFDANINGMMYFELLNEQVLSVMLNTFNNQFLNGRFQRLWWAQGVSPHRN